MTEFPDKKIKSKAPDSASHIITASPTPTNCGKFPRK